MDESKIIDQLQIIFDDIFDETQPTINMELSAAEVDEWDSLTNIRLIVAIEQVFSIKFRPQEIEELNTAGDLVNSIKKKLA